LTDGARELADSGEPGPGAEGLVGQSEWDPFAFTDLCEAALHGHSSNSDWCRRVAQLEWQLLFDYCYRQAIGS